MTARDLPWKLAGFDIHMRICWRWPFFVSTYFGKVWRLPKPMKVDIGGHEATVYEKTSLPPG